ncbi:MAG TPA: hypothetical protein PK079_14985 [Leptospiraceae bacterium]|nr:hypothetical protein [Leptospiraceae bacterium]HMW07807.1 hypothetical protein [Leptospiraceae bacterium]HMX35372.1 hypothetical protein [Leptospiraceae bacterium]HMY33508.1 hypothetical protein [Leptospiraceae bacterium]HMZ67345.1 hypothetical protein [Leptospiraceae bacterium]
MIHIVIPVLVVLSYFLFRNLWFELRKNRILASIEKISLGIIEPGIILPEVSIRYKYYYEEGVYYGTGYLLLQDFLYPYEYRAGFTQEGVPYIAIGDKSFLSEEHIETFLINQCELVSIFIDPVEPFHSELESIYTESIGVEELK